MSVASARRATKWIAYVTIWLQKGSIVVLVSETSSYL